MTTHTSRRDFRCVALAILLFVATFLLRFLDARFHNEHLELLTAGRQIVAFGEHPIRDWIDPGRFLAYELSAAVQLLFGYRLLGDALLSIGLISLTTSLVFVLAARASRSLAIGAAAALLCVLTYPRLYNYYKVALLAIGILVMWRYADRRSRGAAVVLAFATAVAAMIRQDFGVYFLAGSLAVVWLAHWPESAIAALRRCALYVAALGMWMLPFLAYVQLNGGVADFYRVALDFGQREKGGIFPGASILLPGLRPFEVDWSEPLLRVAPAADVPRPRVTVRWSRSVTPELQAELEGRYGLQAPRRVTEDSSGRRWEYDLVDTSGENVASLVGDRRVEDTDGIDRRRAVVRDMPSESTWSALQRQVPILRVAVAPGLLRPANVDVGLYHVYHVLPLVVLAVLVLRMVGAKPSATIAHEVPKIVAAAIFSLLAIRLLVPHASHARLSDVGPAALILGAWLLGQVRPPGDALHRVSRWTDAGRGLRHAFVLLAVGTAASSLVVVGRDELPFGLPLGDPSALVDRTVEQVERLSASPPLDRWAGRDSVGLRALVRYVHECSGPEDRVFVTSYRPEVSFYSGRAFAGAVPFLNQDHFSSPATQRRIVDRLATESVPIVVADAQAYRAHLPTEQRLIHEYLTQRYAIARESSFGDSPSESYLILTDRLRAATREYTSLSLPCFD